MRRIALYSDVHGNVIAYRAVLADIASEGITERYCLGDLVGLGSRPNEAVALAHASGDVLVQGNYDRAIGLHLVTPGSEVTSAQQELDAAESYGFTVAEVSAATGDVLHWLPVDWHLQESGVRITLCHGLPGQPGGSLAPDASPATLVELALEAGADVVCCGHTHVPLHRSVPTASEVVHWVNAGSVGRPRDGDPRAAWVELVLGSEEDVVSRAPTDIACRRAGATDVWLGVVVHRARYDIEAVVLDMVRCGLPPTLAAGLRTGLEEDEYVRPGTRASARARTRAEVVELEPAVGPVLACGHKRDECTCLFDERTAAYEALARIYRGQIPEAAAAVRRLRVAMSTCRVHRNVDEAVILEAYRAADSALRSVDGRAAFEEERERLYGFTAGFDPFVNVLSAEETTYLSGTAEEQLAALEAAYLEAAFTVPEIGDAGRMPAHISSELSFMAHCLRAASSGEARALDRARRFFAGHLSAWAVLFAAVVSQESRTPVMRYAGLTLDKLLACEAVSFRYEVPAHPGLRAGRP